MKEERGKQKLWLSKQRHQKEKTEERKTRESSEVRKSTRIGADFASDFSHFSSHDCAAGDWWNKRQTAAAAAATSITRVTRHETRRKKERLFRKDGTRTREHSSTHFAVTLPEHEQFPNKVWFPNWICLSVWLCVNTQTISSSQTKLLQFQLLELQQCQN